MAPLLASTEVDSSPHAACTTCTPWARRLSTQRGRNCKSAEWAARAERFDEGEKPTKEEDEEEEEEDEEEEAAASWPSNV